MNWFRMGVFGVLYPGAAIAASWLTGMTVWEVSGTVALGILVGKAGLEE